MTVFRLPEPVEVEDLGLRSDRAVFLGEPAGDRLVTEAGLAGLRVGDGDDVVTLTPGGIATGFALRAFKEASDAHPGDVVGRLDPALGDWPDQPLFGDPARMVRLRGGGALTPDRLAAARQIVVGAPKYDIPFQLADRPGGSDHKLAVSEAVLVSTGHWSGVLWGNLLALGPKLWAGLVGAPWQAPFRLFWAWVWTGARDPMVIGGALTRYGKGAEVHPTAVVEGCIVGDGAKIGPGAVVRASIIGAGASVEAQALVAFSVLGPKSHVQRKGWCQFSVLHEGAACGGAMQMGVLGPGAALKHGGTLMDQDYGGVVRGKVRGQLVPAPLGLLGVGVGRDALIASGVQIGPGRNLPPGIRIGPPAGSVVVRIPEGITGEVEVVDGGLVPRNRA